MLCKMVRSQERKYAEWLGINKIAVRSKNININMC